MTPEQLDAIQKRADRVADVRAVFYVTQNSVSDSQNDVPALIAYARDLEARIGRVEALIENTDDTVVTQADGVHVPVYLVRAALTATEGQA